MKGDLQNDLVFGFLDQFRIPRPGRCGFLTAPGLERENQTAMKSNNLSKTK